METERPEPLVIVRREGPITRITLNRPRAINALNHEMFRLLLAAVQRAQLDGSAAILLDGAGDRGFCGGGDVKQFVAEEPQAILRDEYRLDHAVGTSRIPVIGFMDGITMGGGIGLAGHASHRIVTERSRLAMPEVRIGIVPDVGGHLLLARAPGRLGELLAVTAGDLRAGDAIALGFADAFVPSERLPALAEALAAGERPDSAVSRFTEPAPDSPLLASSDWWRGVVESAADERRLPAFLDPAGAAQRLIAAVEAAAATGDRRAAEVADTVRSMCPVAVAVTLAQIDRTRALGLDLAAVLADDLRTLGRLMPRHDFPEGVRAQLIEKDRTPLWQPARLEHVDPGELAAIVDPTLVPGEVPLTL